MHNAAVKKKFTLAKSQELAKRYYLCTACRGSGNKQ